MSKRTIRILILLVIGAIVLTGCAAGVRAESTPGVTVVDEAVYIAYLSKLYKLDRATGALLSSFPEGRSSVVMYAPPAVSEGGVYFGDLANEFHKVNDSNLNEILWTFDGARGWYQARAGVDGGLVIIPSSDRNVYALEKTTGELIWSYQGEFAFVAEPLIIADKVVVSAQDFHVVVLDLATGEELYRVETKGAVTSSPLYDPQSGNLFVGSFGKEMTSFNLETGEVNWVFGVGRGLATIWATPILVGDQLIFNDKSGKIVSLDPETGQELWTIEAGGTTIAGLAAIDEGGFVVAREDGNIQAYKLDRTSSWTGTVPGNVYTAPIVQGEQIFIPVINADSILYTFNVSGQAGWSFTPSN
jgi:outer membrane protein assembly factor BamB